MNPPLLSKARIDRTRYLALAVADVRARGYVSAADPGREPTWRAARARLTGGDQPTAADIRRAHEILGWVASLHPRDPDGYRADLRACFAYDHLTDEDLPLAASAVRAFHRHLFFEIRGRHRDHRNSGVGWGETEHDDGFWRRRVPWSPRIVRNPEWPSQSRTDQPPSPTR